MMLGTESLILLTIFPLKDGFLFSSISLFILRVPSVFSLSNEPNGLCREMNRTNIGYSQSSEDMHLLFPLHGRLKFHFSWTYSLD